MYQYETCCVGERKWVYYQNILVMYSTEKYAYSILKSW